MTFLSFSPSLSHLPLQHSFICSSQSRAIITRCVTNLKSENNRWDKCVWMVRIFSHGLEFSRNFAALHGDASLELEVPLTCPQREQTHLASSNSINMLRIRDAISNQILDHLYYLIISTLLSYFENRKLLYGERIKPVPSPSLLPLILTACAWQQQLASVIVSVIQ